MVHRSFFRSHLTIVGVAATLLLTPIAFQATSHAGPLFSPCNFAGSPPECNGFCANPGEVCAPNAVPPLDECNCVPAGGPGDACELASPTACIGECAPNFTCIWDGAAGCICAIPTLSEWGIIGMAFVMLGGTLYHRRRRMLG